MLLVADFFMWWYTVGWLQRVAGIKKLVFSWLDYFSFGTLIKTLFKPWKQIVNTGDSHRSLAQKKSAFVDNLVSRMVGFFVRSFVLIFGMFVVAAVFILSVMYVVVWPLIPIMPVLALVMGTW